MTALSQHSFVWWGIQTAVEAVVDIAVEFAGNERYMSAEVTVFASIGSSAHN